MLQALSVNMQAPKYYLVSHTQSFTATKEAPRSCCSLRQPSRPLLHSYSTGQCQPAGSSALAETRGIKQNPKAEQPERAISRTEGWESGQPSPF